MKTHINAVMRAVELVFEITPKDTITAINSLKADKLHERFLNVWEKAKARYKGYNDEAVKEMELKWASDYLERFSLGNPYHLLLTKYKTYIEGKVEFNFEKDLAEAKKIEDLSDRLFYWQGRLNDYDRLYKYNDGIKITVVLGGFSYEQLVEHEIEFIEAHLKAKEKKPSKSLRSSKPQKPDISFVWQGNAETELPKLHQRLITEEMIDEKTDLEAFTATFTGQPTDNIKPIKWIADNRLLAHFLHQSFKGQNWQSISEKGKLFCNQDDKPITASDLANAKSRLKNNTKPKGIKLIERILSEIK